MLDCFHKKHAPLKKLSVHDKKLIKHPLAEKAIQEIREMNLFKNTAL